MGLKFGNKNKSSFKMKGAPIQKGTTMYKKMVSPVKEDPKTTTATIQTQYTPPPNVKIDETFEGGKHGYGQITKTTEQKGYTATKTMKDVIDEWKQTNPDYTEADLAKYKSEVNTWIDEQKKTNVQVVDKAGVEITVDISTIPEQPMQTAIFREKSTGHNLNQILINGNPQQNVFPQAIGGRGTAGGAEFTDREVDHIISSGGWNMTYRTEDDGSKTPTGIWESPAPAYQLMENVDGESKWIIPGNDAHVNLAKSTHMKGVTDSAAAEYNTLKENGGLTRTQLLQGKEGYVNKAYHNEYKKTATMDKDQVKDQGLWFMRPDVEFSDSSAALNNKFGADGVRRVTTQYLDIDDGGYKDRTKVGIKTNEDITDLYDLEGTRYSTQPFMSEGVDTPRATKSRAIEEKYTNLLSEAQNQGYADAQIVKINSGDGFMINKGEKTTTTE